MPKVDIFRPNIYAVPADVYAYVVGAAGRASTAGRILAAATSAFIGRGYDGVEDIDTALAAYEGTLSELGSYDATYNTPEARWCARAVADALARFVDSRGPDADEFSSPIFEVEGLRDAWTVLGADPNDDATLATAASVVAHGIEAARVAGLLDVQQLESATATAAAWSLLAAHAGPPALCIDVQVGTDLHERADAYAMRILGIAREAEEERAEPVDLPPEIGPADGIVVLPALGGLSSGSSGREVAKEFGELAGKRVRRVPVPDDLAAVRERLVGEFPYAERAIVALLTDLAPLAYVRFRPTVLVGPAGAGKSRLVRRLAEECGVYLSRFDCSSSFDSAIGGCPRRWSTAEPSWPLLAIKTARLANPLVMLDEIDKSGGGDKNGRLDAALLPMLERETARAYPDPYVQAPVDLSWVSWIATANDDALLPATLKDRFRVLRVPRPGAEHLQVLSRSICGEIVTEQGFDQRWAAGGLDGDELELAADLWRGGSVRRLRLVIERLLARREVGAARH